MSKTRHPMPNDYWIVTATIFREHSNYEDAYAERARLRASRPGLDYRVVHCKRRIKKNQTATEVIAALREEIARLNARLAGAQSEQRTAADHV